MASNPVVNSLVFSGSVAGQVSIQAQGIAGGLTFLLPNLVPVQGQLLNVVSVNGNNVFLGFTAAQGADLGDVTSVFGRSGVVTAQSGDYSYAQISGTPQLPITKAAVTSNFLTSYTSGTGLFTAAQPNFTDLAGSIATGQIPASTITVAQINSKRGNGGFVQLAASGTAGAAGNVVTFDANGNTVDGAVLLSSLAPLASPTFTGTVVLPSAVNATGGSDLILTATSTNEVRIATATGVFDFFGSGGANGMSLATGNASIVINSSGQIALAAAPNQDVELTASGTGIIVTNATLLAEHNIDLSDANAHIVPNHDVAGTTAITNPATTIAVVYGSNYTGTNAPNVVVTAVGADPTGLGGVWITHQGGANAWTGFTINVTTTPGTSASFSYHVIG